MEAEIDYINDTLSRTGVSSRGLLVMEGYLKKEVDRLGK
jgi:hypothetical protein